MFIAYRIPPFRWGWGKYEEPSDADFSRQDKSLREELGALGVYVPPARDSDGR